MALAPIPVTASTLFAQAHGRVCSGSLRCSQCSGPCMKNELRNRFPNGALPVPVNKYPWLCHGCFLSFSGQQTVTFPDGSRLDGTTVREHSWIITADRAIACGSLHLDVLRQACLQPPEPPYAIVLNPYPTYQATMRQQQREQARKIALQKHAPGQGTVKPLPPLPSVPHLLWKAPVVQVATEPALLFGEHVIPYEPAQLAELLELAGKIVAAAGREALDAKVIRDKQTVEAIVGRYQDAEQIVVTWMQALTGQDPLPHLARCAAWLCHTPDECRRLYPATVEQSAESAPEKTQEQPSSQRPQPTRRQRTRETVPAG